MGIKCVQFNRFVIKNFRLSKQLVINCVFIVIFSVPVSAVVRHLLNLNFWVTSLQANNDSPFFGNLLSTNYALSLNLENFYENIDGGSPTPTESGENHFIAQHKILYTFHILNNIGFGVCSDECLAELLNSNHQCVISKRCLLIMSLNNTAHGYHLTHKYVILYTFI